MLSFCTNSEVHNDCLFICLLHLRKFSFKNLSFWLFEPVKGSHHFSYHPLQSTKMAEVLLKFLGSSSVSYYDPIKLGLDSTLAPNFEGYDLREYFGALYWVDIQKDMAPSAVFATFIGLCDEGRRQGYSELL